MANFYDNLFESSWRGVPFFVESSGGTLGRRVVVHEFVQGDKPFVEDLGRDTRKQKLSGWIVAKKSNNFNPWGERDALIRAVEQGGEDTFVSPFYGEQRGHITNFSITETSTKDGGLIKFEFEFIEAGLKAFTGVYKAPLRYDDTPLAEPAYSAVESDFNESFDVDGYASYVRDSAAKNIGEFLKQTSTFKISTFSPYQLTRAIGINQTIATVQNARNQLQQIVNGATMTAGAVSNGILTIVSSLENLTNLKSWALPVTIPFNTISRKRDQQNTQALTNLIRCAAVIRSAEIAANITTPRYDTTDTDRGLPQLITAGELDVLRSNVSLDLTGQIEDLSDQFTFDATQIELLKLRTDTVGYMTEQSEHLARVFFTKTCDANTAQVWMPSLVIAYRHYGALVDESINIRNDIPHPLFVAPHRELELLALDNLDTYTGVV